MADEMLTGFLAGQADSNNNSGGFGGFGEGLWAVIILAMIFGGGFGGFGGFGGGGAGAAMLNGIATRADINEGFALQNITGGIQGIQQGICDSTYALNNAISGGFNGTQMGMMQGFNGVERGFCDLSHQLSDCCCENRMAIAQLRYDMASQACDTRNLIQGVTRDLMENQNNNYRGLMDYLVRDKMETLRDENQALRFAASQSAQNAFITANQEAQTAELIRRLRTPEAVPAYVVPNPNCCYGNPVGIGYGYGGNNGGCGCGC